MLSPLIIRPLQALHREILPKMNAIQKGVSTLGRLCADDERGVEEAAVYACVCINGGGVPTARFRVGPMLPMLTSRLRTR